MPERKRFFQLISSLIWAESGVTLRSSLKIVADLQVFGLQVVIFQLGCMNISKDQQTDCFLENEGLLKRPIFSVYVEF